MSTAAERKREYQTLAWITDDEAEFWTNYSPTTRKEKFYYRSASKDSKDSSINSSDDLSSKSNKQVNTEGIDKQTKEGVKQKGKKGIEQQGKEKTGQQGKEGTGQQGKYGIGQQGKGGTEQQGKQAKDADDNATKKQMSKFDENNQLNSEIEDPLLLSYKKKIDDQAKVVEKEVEAKRLSEIFEFDDNNQLNENVPGVNMSFLDRLLHQLTRPRDPINSYHHPSDDEYTEIDHREVTAVTNDNIIESSDSENKMKNNIPLKESLQTFIEELIEETDVIRGSIDEETLFNRRSRIAKSSLPMIKNNQIEVNGTSK